MSPQAIIGIVLAIVLGAAIWGVKYAVDTYTETIQANAELAESVRLRDLTIEAKNKRLALKDARLAQLEVVASARAASTERAQEELNERERELAELRRKNPTVDAFLAQPVPAELRGSGKVAATGGTDAMRSADDDTATTKGPATDRRNSR